MRVFLVSHKNQTRKKETTTTKGLLLYKKNIHKKRCKEQNTHSWNHPKRQDGCINPSKDIFQGMHKEGRTCQYQSVIWKRYGQRAVLQKRLEKSVLYQQMQSQRVILTNTKLIMLWVYMCICIQKSNKYVISVVMHMIIHYQILFNQYIYVLIFTW